jgi:hypothetical protein
MHKNRDKTKLHHHFYTWLPVGIYIESQGFVDIPHSIAIKCTDHPEGTLSQTICIGIIPAGAPVAFPGRGAAAFIRRL